MAPGRGLFWRGEGVPGILEKDVLLAFWLVPDQEFSIFVFMS